MLLNRLPCLDKGYVAYISSSCTSDKLHEVAIEFFKNDNIAPLKEMSTLTLVIKCPLFVQLNLSTHNFKIIPVPPSEVEAYMPNIGEIGSPALDVNKAISELIKRTTDALLINPKGFQEDGCDRFMSQVVMPINTYTTLLVHGPYNEWKKFCDQQRMPAPIKAYIKGVTQIMNAEWR